MCFSQAAKVFASIPRLLMTERGNILKDRSCSLQVTKDNLCLLWLWLLNQPCFVKNSFRPNVEKKNFPVQNADGKQKPWVFFFFCCCLGKINSINFLLMLFLTFEDALSKTSGAVRGKARPVWAWLWKETHHGVTLYRDPVCKQSRFSHAKWLLPLTLEDNTTIFF